MDILATNRLGEALYSEMLANSRRPANSARFCFLDPRATTFFVDWGESADASVAVLRAEAGRNPHDQDLTNLIGELSTQSEDFRVRWARHDVGAHDSGRKRLQHPLVGHLELGYEGMTLAADADLVLFVFTAEVGSKSEEAPNLLASWTATEAEPIVGRTRATATETAPVLSASARVTAPLVEHFVSPRRSPRQAADDASARRRSPIGRRRSTGCLARSRWPRGRR